MFVAVSDMLAFQSHEVLTFMLIMYSSGRRQSEDSCETDLGLLGTVANSDIATSCSVILYIDKCFAPHVYVDHTVLKRGYSNQLGHRTLNKACTKDLHW